MLSFMHHFHVDFEMVMLFQANFFPSFFFFFQKWSESFIVQPTYEVFRFLSLVIYFFFSRGEINAMAECFVSLYSETNSLF